MTEKTKQLDPAGILPVHELTPTNVLKRKDRNFRNEIHRASAWQAVANARSATGRANR